MTKPTGPSLVSQLVIVDAHGEGKIPLVRRQAPVSQGSTHAIQPRVDLLTRLRVQPIVLRHGREETRGGARGVIVLVKSIDAEPDVFEEPRVARHTRPANSRRNWSAARATVSNSFTLLRLYSTQRKFMHGQATHLTQCAAQ